MELSWCAPSRTNGRESNNVVESPPARAEAAASRARTSGLRTDIDRSVDVEARPGIGRAGDEDVAAGVHRPGMAAGAVGEDDHAVRTDAGRSPVAGRAGGHATRGHLEGVAALAGNTRFAARQIVAVAVLAVGEIPPGVPHQVAVELRVVRIEDSALVDAGAEERELPVHHPGAHGGVGPGDRLVDRIGAGWIDGLEQERVRLTCDRNRRV